MKNFVRMHKFKKKKQTTKIITFPKNNPFKPEFKPCPGENEFENQGHGNFLLVIGNGKKNINARRVVRNNHLIWSYGFITKPKNKNYYCAFNFISEI